MALNLPPDQAQQWRDITEDVFDIPRGSIAKDPEAAAILASYGAISALLLSANGERTRGKRASE